MDRIAVGIVRKRYCGMGAGWLSSAVFSANIHRRASVSVDISPGPEYFRSVDVLRKSTNGRSKVAGGVAQLGARLNGIQKVGGSNPPTSTSSSNNLS